MCCIISNSPWGSELRGRRAARPDGLPEELVGEGLQGGFTSISIDLFVSLYTYV